MYRVNPFKEMAEDIKGNLLRLGKALNPNLDKEGKRKVVYIAGKISGDEYYENKFNIAKNNLVDLGFIVLNPASLPWGLEYEQYLRIGLSMLNEADIIYLLDDYKDSPGALKEIEYAKQKGIMILKSID